MELSAGTAAPAFARHSTPDEPVSLNDFRGRPIVLVFYPADWSPVCGDQLALYNEVLPEFQRLSTQIIGISVGGVIRWQSTSPVGVNRGADGILIALEGLAEEAHP